MQVDMNYSDFQESQPILSSATAELSNQVEMNLSIIPSTNISVENLCLISLKDKIGIDEISEKINKDDIRQLLNILKITYNQLQNMESINNANNLLNK